MLGGDVVVDRVVLEHHDGVEQVDPTGQVAPGLDLGQRDEVEAPGLRLGRLQLAQPPHDVTGAVHVGSHRHRVDEDPGDGVHARQIRRPPRHRRTEADLTLAAVAGKQQGPRPLHDGVEREAVALGELGEPGGLGLSQLEGQPRRRTGGVRLARRPVVGQRRR